MEVVHLYIMDMSLSGSTSGVDRYIEKLLEGLKHYPSVCVHWIQFLYDENLILYREEQTEYYTKITFPLPLNYTEIITERFWRKKYNTHILHLIRRFISRKENNILHLQTLNLIDLALLIKQQVGCSIITHLHCIPWKGYYNLDMRRFNCLYETARSNFGNVINRALFLTDYSELDSYTQADHIISVTKCGADFLTNVIGIPQSKVSIIPNGIDDYSDNFERQFGNYPYSSIQCLFVANLSKGKGLEFVLQALRILKRKGVNVSLKIAGSTTQEIIDAIRSEYNDLDVNFLGVCSFMQLVNLYKSSDIGLIASLQEQCSFAAIEMAMFGLPLITTAVDGLDELFTDNVNALKIYPSFSPVFGLRIDAGLMAKKIELLIENVGLRKKLSRNVRMLYENELTLCLMIERTINVYEQISEKCL